VRQVRQAGTLIETDHEDGIALFRVDKASSGYGPPRKLLLVTTDTLEVMHDHIIRQYAPTPAP
jgi:hypothetical protein